MTADVVPPWIDLNIQITHNFETRYTHAHDFNNGKVSIYGTALTEAQIRSYFATIGHTDIISAKLIARTRTRMDVEIRLFPKTLWIDAMRLRETIDLDLRKHRHTAKKTAK